MNAALSWHALVGRAFLDDFPPMRFSVLTAILAFRHKIPNLPINPFAPISRKSLGGTHWDALHLIQHFEVDKLRAMCIFGHHNRTMCINARRLKKGRHYWFTTFDYRFTLPKPTLVSSAVWRMIEMKGGR